MQRIKILAALCAGSVILSASLAGRADCQVRVAEFTTSRVTSPARTISVRRPAYTRPRNQHQTRPLPPELARVIAETAIAEQVDELFLLEMMRQESGFFPGARSSKGARGLMQFIPATAKRFAVKNPEDPHEAVQGACKYIHYLSGLFGNNPELILAAYNAGEGAVIRAGNRIPRIPETQQYVASIMSGYARARSLESRVTGMPSKLEPVRGAISRSSKTSRSFLATSSIPAMGSLRVAAAQQP